MNVFYVQNNKIVIMINFFEYFFYRIYDLYTRQGEKDVPVFYGIAVLSTVQSLNIIIFVNLYFILQGHYEITQHKWTLWIGATSFIINYIYFMKNKRFEKIIKHYSDENRNQKKKKGIFVLVYAILVFITLIYTVEKVRIINL